MNAPNPVPSATGGGDARPYEPSMEEILASIRRIIADDQSLPGRARAEDTAVAETAPASVHLLHTDEASVSEQDQPATETAPEPTAVPDQEPAGEMVAQGSIAAPQYPSPEMPAFEPVAPEPAPALSDRLEAIHHRAHGETAKQGIAERQDGDGDYFDPPEEHDRQVALTAGASPLFSATTNSSVASAFNLLAASRLADNSDELLAMAREMIRPLLRSWLDENLPNMVERMVRDEIERVARGGQ